MAQHSPLTRDEEWKYAEKAMTWYGWGSPVGLGIMLVCLGTCGADRAPRHHRALGKKEGAPRRPSRFGLRPPQASTGTGGGAASAASRPHPAGPGAAGLQQPHERRDRPKAQDLVPAGERRRACEAGVDSGRTVLEQARNIPERVKKISPTSATPIEPPTCWKAWSAPDAEPASRGGTPPRTVWNRAGNPARGQVRRSAAAAGTSTDRRSGRARR